VQIKDGQHRRGTPGAVTRRGFIKGAAAIAAAGSLTTLAQRDPGAHLVGSKQDRTFAYVGCYTPNGQGIYLFELNPANGKLTQIKVFQGTDTPLVSTRNPSWLAFDPQRKYLYAGNEISDFGGTTNGAVSAFAVDRSNGDLTFLNSISSEGSGPAHLSVDPSGRYVLVANYGGGNVAVLPIQSDGSLGSATDVKNDADACGPSPCPLGPMRAQKAPPGSFAISGHDRPHAHMIQTDPAGNFVIVSDLGLDLTIIWKFNREAGTLSDPKTFPTSPGAGPRHFAFHPNGRWFYSLNEEASTLDFMIYDARRGSLEPVEEVSTLPSNFVGTNFTSEVIVSHDGRFIYAANRLHDTIAIFAIDGTGAPKLIGEEWTRADYPRNCNIDPSGNFLFVCNHRGDSITTFRIDGHGRRLRFTGQYTPVGSPAVIVFL
jgi:6-phosphogluconolactonase